MKKTVKAFILPILALIFCVLLASCGADKDADAEIHSLSVGYLTESAYNNGNYSEKSITDKPYFQEQSPQYMVIDFKIKALLDNSGDQSVKVTVHASEIFALTVAVQDAPTGKIESFKNEGGTPGYYLFYSIPTNKGEEKGLRTILKLLPNAGGSTDVTVLFSGDSHTTVKGETDASASFRVPTSNLQFSLKSDGTYSANATANCADQEIVIPSMYNGKPVTEIGDMAFQNCTGMTSIVIPASVTHIGSFAFSGCTGLAGIDIPHTVTSIGASAFSGCASLTRIIIPEGVTEIGDSAFADCDALTSVAVPNDVTSIGCAAFRGCASLTSITLPFVGNTASGISNTHFGYIFGADAASANSDYVPSSLKTVVITGGERIDYAAFYGCSALTDVVISESVTALGAESFADCTGLASITVPDSVTSIGYAAFRGCASLTKITLPFVGNTASGTSNRHFGYIFGATSVSANGEFVPPSLKSVVITSAATIGDSAFRDCGSLTSVTVPDCLTSIGYETFYGCTGLTGIAVPAQITGIGKYAFYGCKGLTSMTVPDYVMSIGEGAFGDCTNLTSITLPFVGNTANGTSNTHFGYIFGANNPSDSGEFVPQSLKTVVITGSASIGKGAFSSCTGITDITLSEGIASIGEEAFFGCTGLTSLALPDSVTSIGAYAFNGCSGLTSMTVPVGVTSLEASVFRGCTGLTSITVPNTVISIGYEVFGDCTNLTTLALPFVGNTANGTDHTHFGYIFGAASPSENGSCVPSSLKTLVITGDARIGAEAFRDCVNLTSITVSDSVTYIGHSAFDGCSGLTSVSLPAGLRAIEKYTFSGCCALTSIVIPDGVADIGSSAFRGCVGLSSIVIPDSVKSIGESAFCGCTGLTGITVPDGVEIIGYAAFSGCINVTSMTLPFVGNTANGTSNTHFGYIFGAHLSSYNAKYVPASLKTLVVTSGTEISKEAFLGCSHLTGITVPDSVMSIGESAFSGCSALTSLILPDGVTTVGKEAFRACSALTSITVPDSITCIDNYAFDSCADLSTVNFGGTGSQWQAIDFGYNWDYCTGNYTVTCTDGTLSKR